MAPIRLVSNEITRPTCTSEYTVYTDRMPSPYWSRLRAILAPGDWLYRDAHYLVAEMDIDPAAAKAWVPSPLRLASPATATLFTAWFPSTTFGSVYSEAGLFLHVTHCGRPAVFSPWMIVDDDVALITGRELLGYPKKMGEIDFRLDGGAVSGVARRRGAELVRMTGTVHEELPGAPPVLARPHRNVRASMGLAVPKVIAFTPREEAISVRRVDLTVTVGGSERDPLADLGFGRVRAARLHRVNLGASLPPIPVAGVSPLWFLKQWLLRAR
jgi:acetoacetate decarboxylase